MSKIVNRASQVAANAVRFAEELEASEKLQERLPYARAWYAFPDDGGGWAFVPSKFGGYENMTAREYLDDTPRDGRRTERQLSQWFQEVPEDTELYETLYEGLFTFLHAYNRAPSAKARISVSKEVYARHFDDGGDDEADLLELLIRIARRLPARHRTRLRAEI